MSDMITAMTENEFGRGWAIAMGVLLVILLIGYVLHVITKPRGRGRGRRY